MLTGGTKIKTFVTSGFVLEQRKMQGRKTKTRELTGTIYIFKPTNKDVMH